MNAKAMNILHCSLGPNEFARVCLCKTAKEVWDFLQATHEGDTSTKQTMLALGNSEYESFKIGQHESIQDANRRFNEIINKLGKLGKEYSTSELNTKILLSLPKEGHNSIVDLLPKCATESTAHIWSSLYSHEFLMIKIKEEYLREDPKRTNAFKASKEESSDDSSDSNDESNETDETSNDSNSSSDEEEEEREMRKKYKSFLQWKFFEDSRRRKSKKKYIPSRRKNVISQGKFFYLLG
ncbi:hypothetical protein DM860_015081 [Cuscuta australis]|uniref:UBN2 domain-containing protein n=1 Tax=Cuscuta australis TaxID=267555 RepID=A0A328DV69_9ASTE|nr:hypothetical protein DM860_015081 [Cuscuta australis]